MPEHVNTRGTYGQPEDAAKTTMPTWAGYAIAGIGIALVVGQVAAQLSMNSIIPSAPKKRRFDLPTAKAFSRDK
jgi:hypothetical protein